MCKCYLVTGAIGPFYRPRLFTTRALARAYVQDILADNARWTVPMRPVIEERDARDMVRTRLESTYQKGGA